jgi:DMSO reductase anchor subunit
MIIRLLIFVASVASTPWYTCLKRECSTVDPSCTVVFLFLSDAIDRILFLCIEECYWQ